MLSFCLKDQGQLTTLTAFIGGLIFESSIEVIDGLIQQERFSRFCRQISLNTIASRAGEEFVLSK